jgi:hypothetical protein
MNTDEHGSRIKKLLIELNFSFFCRFFQFLLVLDFSCGIPSWLSVFPPRRVISPKHKGAATGIAALLYAALRLRN